MKIIFCKDEDCENNCLGFIADLKNGSIDPPPLGFRGCKKA